MKEVEPYPRPYYTSLEFGTPTGTFRIRLGETKKEILDHGLTFITRYYLIGEHDETPNELGLSDPVTRIGFCFDAFITKGDEIIFQGDTCVWRTIKARYLKKDVIPPTVFSAIEELNSKAYEIFNSAQNFYWVYDFMMKADERPKIGGGE